MQSIDDLKQQIRSFVNLEHLKCRWLFKVFGWSPYCWRFANLLIKVCVPLTKYVVFGAVVNAATGYERAWGISAARSAVGMWKIILICASWMDVDDFLRWTTQNRTVTLPEFGTVLLYVVSFVGSCPETTSAAPDWLRASWGRTWQSSEFTNKYIFRKLRRRTGRYSRRPNAYAIICRVCLRPYCVDLNLTTTLWKRPISTFKTLSYFAALWDLDPSSEEYNSAI